MDLCGGFVVGDESPPVEGLMNSWPGVLSEYCDEDDVSWRRCRFVLLRAYLYLRLVLNNPFFFVNKNINK